jgi:hypothetical protein
MWALNVVSRQSLNFVADCLVAHLCRTTKQSPIFIYRINKYRPDCDDSKGDDAVF